MSAGDRDTLTDAEMALSFTVAGDDQFHDQLFDAETVAHIVAARVRTAQAQAWDEGHDAVFDHAVDWEGWLNIDGRYTQDALPNPYRQSDD